MSIHEGAKYLEKTFGGRGMLLGGVPGVLPAKVLILGGGIVGTEAAKMAAGLGADVTIMDKKKNNALSLATQNERKETIALLVAKGAKLDGTAKPADPPIIGTWEGIKSSNPYALYRFTFKSDKTWTYTASASAAFKKEYPDQVAGMNEQLKSQTGMEGSKGSFSFREQFIVLKTDSVFTPERVYQWKLDNGKLNLNGGEFVLSKAGK